MIDEDSRKNSSEWKDKIKSERACIVYIACQNCESYKNRNYFGDRKRFLAELFDGVKSIHDAERCAKTESRLHRS